MNIAPTPPLIIDDPDDTHYTVLISFLRHGLADLEEFAVDAAHYARKYLLETKGLRVDSLPLKSMASRPIKDTAPPVIEVQYSFRAMKEQAQREDGDE